MARQRIKTLTIYLDCGTCEIVLGYYLKENG